MALQTTEPAQLDRLMVLRSGGEVKSTIDSQFASFRDHETIETARQLRTIRAAGGKEMMRAGLAVKEGETRFNIRKMTDFKERFGAGNKGVIPPSSPSEVASYKKAEQSLRENKTIALFIELKSLSDAERATMLGDPQVIAELGPGINNFNAIRKEALKLIARSDAVKGLFPELDVNMLSPSQKMEFLEATLFPSDDARFAARFGTRLQEAYKKAVSLEAVMTDEKKTDLEQQKKVEETRFDQRIKKITGLLTARGLTQASGGAITDADVQNWINTIAFTPETTTDAIASQILGVSLETTSDLRRYVIDIPQNKAKLEAVVASKLTSGVTLSGYLSNPAHANESEVIALNSLNAEYVALDGKYKVGGPKNGDLVAFNSSGLPQLYVDGVLGGLSSEAKQCSLKIEDISAQMSARPQKLSDVERSRDLRTLQEEDLLGEIDSILGQSIADVLEERYDVMEERMGRLSELQAKEQDEKVKQLTMLLKKKMSTNWIQYDVRTREKDVHREHIKRDVTHLTYAFDKDVALKQLIARDLFGGSDSVRTVAFQNLNVIDGSDMRDHPPVAHSLLSVEQLDQLNKVFESTGSEYRDKLFADMFAARTFTDRNISLLGFDIWEGKLGFKRDEWKYMMQRYEPEITKGLETNHEAHQALKALEAQGVKIDFSMKWVLYVIAVLLGGVTGGATMVGLGAGTAAVNTGAALGSIAGAVGEMGVINKDHMDVNGNMVGVNG